MTTAIRPRPACLRLLIHHTHHTKRIRSMARPVVLWTEINQALFIAFGVVRPERIDTVLRGHLVEPNAREQSSRRFDALCSRGAPLVRYDLRLKLRPLQLALVRDRVDLV